MAGRRYPRWLWALAAIPPIVAVLTAVLAPEPHGHWTEHLTGAGFASAQLVLLLVLVTMLGWRRLGVLLLISFAVVAVGLVLHVISGLEVAHSIWRTTGDPRTGIGYAAGHERAGSADQLVVIGGFAFAAIAGATRQVPAQMAVLAFVMALIPPPFIWPAAGVLVLVLYGLTTSSATFPLVPKPNEDAELVGRSV